MAPEPIVVAKEEAEIIRKVVSSYPAMKFNAPTSFVAFSNDFKYQRAHILDVCHARLKWVDKDKADQIITALPRDELLDLYYIKWLIEGPFKTFADRISLEIEEHEGIRKFYLRLKNLDTWPSNVVYNFCIATRVSIEFPYLVELWGKLLKAGVPTGIAFIIASKCNYYGLKYEGDPWEWHLPGLQNNAGHFWIDPTSDWVRVIDGDMQTSKFKDNFKAAPMQGTPANVIWGQGSRNLLSGLVEMTVKQLCFDVFGYGSVVPTPELIEAVDSFKIWSAVDEDDDDDDVDFDDDEYDDEDDD